MVANAIAARGIGGIVDADIDIASVGTKCEVVGGLHVVEAHGGITAGVDGCMMRVGLGEGDGGEEQQEDESMHGGSLDGWYWKKVASPYFVRTCAVGTEHGDHRKTEKSGELP